MSRHTDTLADTFTTKDTLISLVKRKQWNTVVKHLTTVSTIEYLDTAKDLWHRNALSIALSLKPPISTIQAFRSHRDFETAMNMRDSYCSYLPIHCALRYRASSHIISLLIRSVNKKMLEMTDRVLMTPLHIACNFGCNAHAVNALVVANPSVLKLKAQNGNTPLMFACRCKTVTAATIGILLEYSESSSCMNHQFGDAETIDANANANSNSRVPGEWSALHMAVLQKASLEIVRMLVDANPQLCFQKTFTSRQTPLGLYRFADGDNPEIVKILLGPTRTGMRSATKNEKEHLHKIGVIHQYLSFPQYITGLLKFLLEHFASDSKVMNDGSLPLHIAIQECNSSNLDTDYKRQQRLAHSGECRQKIPEGGQKRRDVQDSDTTGRCFNQMNGIANNDTEDWKLILDCYPSGIRVQNRESMFPFMLAASCSRLDIAFELLCSAPEVITYGDGFLT